MITLSVMMFVKQLDPRKRPAKKNTSSFGHGMSDGWDSNNGHGGVRSTNMFDFLCLPDKRYNCCSGKILIGYE